MVQTQLTVISYETIENIPEKESQYWVFYK